MADACRRMVRALKAFTLLVQNTGACRAARPGIVLARRA
jgi:hypothetical protein